MLDPHGPAGLEHDAVDGTRSDNLLHERQAVLLHVLGRGAQRVGVDVAERVADDQVGMRAAQRAVVRQHDPGLHLKAVGRQLAVGVGERLALRVPPRGGGDETMAPPGLLPDRHIACGELGLEDTTVGMLGGGRPGRVVARRHRHPVEAQVGRTGSSGRVPDVVPGICVADAALHLLVLLPRERRRARP
jgi:hypothetical protein